MSKLSSRLFFLGKKTTVLLHFWRPCKAIGSGVCVLWTITFERNDFWTRHLVRWFALSIAKFNGHKSRLVEIWKRSLRKTVTVQIRIKNYKWMPASRKLKTAKVVGGTSSGRFLVLYQGCVRLTLTTSYRTARRYAPADRGGSTSVCGRIRSPPGLSAARLAGLGAGGTDRRTNGPIAASLNAPPPWRRHDNYDRSVARSLFRIL